MAAMEMTQQHSNRYETMPLTIEESRFLESCVFWMERFVLIVITNYLFDRPGVKSSLVIPAILLLLPTCLSVILFVHRRSIGHPIFETGSSIFFIERVGILALLLYFFPRGRGCFSYALIGASVLVCTSFYMLQQYLCHHLNGENKKFIEMKDRLPKYIQKHADILPDSNTNDSIGFENKEEILLMNETGEDGNVVKKVGAAEDDVPQFSQTLLTAAGSSIKDAVKQFIANQYEIEDLIYEAEEIKDKYEAKGNSESDGDNSWEEVQSIGRIQTLETKSPDATETEGEEDCSTRASDNDCDGDSSWEQGQSDTFTENLFAECQDLQNENDYLTDALYAATKSLEHYKLMETEFSEERLKWNDEVLHLQGKLNSFAETLDKERLTWQDEKNDMCTKLDDAVACIELYKKVIQKRDEEKSALDVIISIADDQRDLLYSKLEVADLSIGHYKKELEKCGEEKNALNETIKAANDVKDELRSKLEYAQLCIEHYQFESKEWYEEKNALNESLGQCQDLVNSYAQLNQTLEAQLHAKAPTSSVNSTDEDQYYTVHAANSLSKPYQDLYYKAEEKCQHYTILLTEREEACRKLNEDHISLSAKLFNETLSAERHKKLVDELKDKCRKLEGDKTELAAKLSAAIVSSEIYKSCLRNF